MSELRDSSFAKPRASYVGFSMASCPRDSSALDLLCFNNATASGAPRPFTGVPAYGLVPPGIPSRTFWQVINTIPLDESSEDMFGYFEHLYEVIHDMPRPPDSFFKKKTGPGHMDKAVKSNQVTSDSESEVFCDSLEQVEPDQPRRLSMKQSLPLNSPQRVAEEKSHHKPSEHAPLPEGKLYQGGATDLQSVPVEKGFNSSPEVIDGSPAGALGQREVDLQVTNTIHALQQDMKKVMERLTYLESWAALQGHTSRLNPCLPTIPHDEKEPPRWPIHLSPPTWFFLLAWPFVVQWLLWCFQRQKR